MKHVSKNYRRFDAPPFDLYRMTCGVNAIIEYFSLPLNKLNEVDFELVANAVKKITKYQLSFTSEEFLSILIQDIIDEKCKSDAAAQKVMELCNQKLHHLLNTSVLI